MGISSPRALRLNPTSISELTLEIADKYQSGKSLSQLAKEYNVTKMAIRYHVLKGGIKPRSFTKVDPGE